MVAAFSAGWASVDPLMKGLKLGGLMNQSLEEDDTFRQGRHHFMTAVNQVLEWTLALEQITRCFEVAKVNYPLTGWHVAKYVVPMGVACLASYQIQVLHISEAANFVQNHLGKMSLVAITVSSVALFVLGETVLAATTLLYLTVGVLDRYNVLPESAQRVVFHANFVIGNFAGLYLGGNFIRLLCALNLVVKAVEKYFEYKRSAEGLVEEEEEIGVSGENLEEEEGPTISLVELEQLTKFTYCTINKAHIHKKPLPPVDEDVKIGDILDIADQIDWSKHEHVVKAKLANDKRWIEVDQFNFEPLVYFRRNLRSMIESIENHDILEGKPASYDMLEFYCRFIAQELQKQDEMTQADILVVLGVEGGEYCGTGKFGIVEEVYESLIAQATGLPLKTRVLVCQQQERQRIWQHIYKLIWRTSPTTQLFGYMSDINAVHNANVFTNLVQAGEKFGIPHQAAKNDQTATINPVSHYLAFSFVHLIEKSFWEGKAIPQRYLTIQQPQYSNDWWKAWKWVEWKAENESPEPYDQDAIMKRFIESIGSPQIPKSDIYSWWLDWVLRQDDLTEDVQEALMDELQDFKKDQAGNLTITFNGEIFEENDEINPKFLKAMLIEMGILNKPWDILGVGYDE